MSYTSWVGWIERHCRGVLLASAIIALACALSLRWLHFDFDVLTMLPAGSPAFDDFKTFVADFGQLNELVVFIHGAPAHELQGFATEFAERLAGLPMISRVQARIDVQAVLDGVLGRYLYNYIPASEYGALRQRLTPAGLDAQAATNRAVLAAPLDLTSARVLVDDPLGLRRVAGAALAESYSGATPGLQNGYMMSPDGTGLLILARPRESAFDISFSERLMQAVRAAEAEARAVAGTTPTVDYAGSYLFALEDAATIRRDVAQYTVLALAGVLLVFYGAYRSLWVLPFAGYPLIVGTLATFALSLLIFDQLNGVSLAFAAMLYGLSIDTGIHFYTRLVQERRHADIGTAVANTLAGIGRAEIAASGTTAAVFAIIGLSHLNAVRQLGWLTTIGMLLTILQFFTLYPALAFTIWRTRAIDTATLDTPRLATVSAAFARRPWPTIVISLIVALGLSWVATGTRIEAGLHQLRPSQSEAARVHDEISERFGLRSSSTAVLVRRATLDEALVANEAVFDQLLRYRDEGLLQSFASVRGILPSATVQRERLKLFNDLPRTEAVATFRDALSRHGFVPDRFEQFFRNFSARQDTIVTMDDPALAPLSALIDRYVRSHDGGYLVATYIEPTNAESLTTIAARLRREAVGDPPLIASRLLLENELANILPREFRLFVFASLASNALVLWLSFTQLRTSIVLILPQSLSLLVLFAAMAWRDIPLDPVNLIVVPLIMGLGVDYCVYLVNGVRQWGDLRLAVNFWGRALVVTTLTTATGFGFVGLSRYPALSTMGVLAGSGLLLCLVFTLTVLPALLAVIPVRFRQD